MHQALLTTIVLLGCTALNAAAQPRQKSPSLVKASVRAAVPEGGVGGEALKYWPQWRGPTWNGVASQADPPVTWSGTENLRWKTPIEGKGYATPIVWGDRIFLLTAITLDKKMPVPDVIPAGTPRTVVLKRGPQFKVLATNDLDERFRASPAIVGDAIYLRGFEHLYCFAKSPR